MDILIVKEFFIRYLLLPLLFIVLATILGIMKKKTPKLPGKVLVCYMLLGALCLGLPGLLGFSGNMFSPYWYILAQLIYFSLGMLHVGLMGNYFNNPNQSASFNMAFEILITLACLTLGAYIFIHLFDLISPFEGYSVMALTSMLIVIIPQLFQYCYIQFMNIPFDIYKTWQHPSGQKPIDFAGVDYDKLMVLNVELAKNMGDGNLFQIKAKTLPKCITFGDWFYKVAHDYNTKNPNGMIELQDDKHEAYSWIFYTKKSLLHPRKYLDFERDMKHNKVSENDTVICKRVIQHQEENLKLAPYKS